MKLPIEHISLSRPPRFKWTTTIQMLGGIHSSSQEGCLPSGVDVAVVDLIDLCKALDQANLDQFDQIAKLKQELVDLQKLNEGLAERIAAQSELLSKRAERAEVMTGGVNSTTGALRPKEVAPQPAPQLTPIRKGLK